MTGTVSTGGQQPVTLEAMMRAMREVDLVAQPTEWTLIAPDGRVWRGDVQHMFMVLAPHHPLLKIGGAA